MLEIDSEPDDQKVLNALKRFGNELHTAVSLNITNRKSSHDTSLAQFNRQQGGGGQH
jgi:hypothetical protein